MTVYKDIKDLLKELRNKPDADMYFEEVYSVLKDAEDRRRKVYWIGTPTFTLLCQFLMDKERRARMTTWDGEPLPADAYLVKVNYDWQRESFGLLFQSKQFEIVPRNQMPPDGGDLRVEVETGHRQVSGIEAGPETVHEGENQPGWIDSTSDADSES